MPGKHTESLTNESLTEEYLSIIRALDGDVSGRCAAVAYMSQSTAIVHHRVVDSTFVPRLFSPATKTLMAKTAETAHRIIVKVIEHYVEDEEYRKLFDFDQRLVDLILIPRRHASVLPFARVDIFLDEEARTIKFCEFNGDGSSGMNENREITNSIIPSATFQSFAEKHETHVCELFDPWVESFINIYRTFENRVDHPTFAICDYLENGVVDEFKIYAGVFESHGYPCIIADVRDLKFDGDTLRDSSGARIDAIWRRCVTNDVIRFWDESQDLIAAAKAGKVAMIGAFSGHIAHDKQLFIILRHPQTKTFLTDEENKFIEKTIPFTAFLDDASIDLDEVKFEKDSWLIKPTDHYGADHVYAGCFVEQEKWEELIDSFSCGKAGFPFIVQEYVEPYRTLTLPPDTGIESKIVDEVTSEPVYYNNLSGLYLFDGVFNGVFSRLGPLPTISKDMKGMTAATIWVDE